MNIPEKVWIVGDEWQYDGGIVIYKIFTDQKSAELFCFYERMKLQEENRVFRIKYPGKFLPHRESRILSIVVKEYPLSNERSYA